MELVTKKTTVMNPSCEIPKNIELTCDLAVDGSPKSKTFISTLNFTPSVKVCTSRKIDGSMNYPASVFLG